LFRRRQHGLEVAAWNGEPGVLLWKIWQENLGSDQRNRKAIKGQPSKEFRIKARKARLETVNSLLMKQRSNQFEGMPKRNLGAIETGVGGFGYDPGS